MPHRFLARQLPFKPAREGSSDKDTFRSLFPNENALRLRYSVRIHFASIAIQLFRWTSNLDLRLMLFSKFSLLLFFASRVNRKFPKMDDSTRRAYLNDLHTHGIDAFWLRGSTRDSRMFVWLRWKHPTWNRQTLFSQKLIIEKIIICYSIFYLTYYLPKTEFSIICLSYFLRIVIFLFLLYNFMIHLYISYYIFHLIFSWLQGIFLFKLPDLPASLSAACIFRLPKNLARVCGSITMFCSDATYGMTTFYDTTFNRLNPAKFFAQCNTIPVA